MCFIELKQKYGQTFIFYFLQSSNRMWCHLEDGIVIGRPDIHPTLLVVSALDDLLSRRKNKQAQKMTKDKSLFRRLHQSTLQKQGIRAVFAYLCQGDKI